MASQVARLSAALATKKAGRWLPIPAWLRAGPPTLVSGRKDWLNLPTRRPVQSMATETKLWSRTPLQVLLLTPPPPKPQAIHAGS